MREIKFRAWDKRNKEMADSKILWLKLNGAELTHISLKKKDFGIFDFIDQVELMQYTGLKDKNGKEIYEGDIVTGYTSYENDNDAREWTVNKPANVYWDEEFCAFYPFYLNARWRCNVVDIEVIGNIYENPELLEVL